MVEPTQEALTLVFGTSADPIHQGHTNLILSAVQSLQKKGFHIAQILILPVYRYHNIRDAVKRALPLTYESRYEICQLAAAEIANKLGWSKERVSVSRLEETLVRGAHRPNLSAETFEVLSKTLGPNKHLAFLLGSDNFSGESPSFNNWYKVEQLLQLTSLVICPRQGFEINQHYLQELENKGAQIVYLEDVHVPEISSSVIRKRLEDGEDLPQLVQEGMLSTEMAAYIDKNQLVDTWRTLDSAPAPQNLADKEPEIMTIEEQIGKILTIQKWTLAVAESCTGGLIGHRITNVPGSSEYFVGGIISYAYEAKVRLLRVSWDTLKAYGAVSSQTVLEMASGVKKALGTDIGLAVSCIAGPGGATPTKPVGTSWVGLAAPEGEWSFHFLLSGDRVENKESLAQKALETLLAHLESKTNLSTSS